MLPKILLDLVFPRRSLSGREGWWITTAERQRMRCFPLRLHRELLRKRGLKSLDCLIAAGSYHSTPLLRKAICTFKYGRIPEMHNDLSALITAALPGLYFTPKRRNQKTAPPPPILCPVPLHWTRRFARGFNQSALLADDISFVRGWQTLSLLKRSRPTGHQAWRTLEKRLTALTGAFRYIGPKKAPGHVILIDDLFTSGRTLDECAKELKRAGVKRVEAFTVAYG